MKKLTFHPTTSQAAAEIKERGIDVTRARHAAYGGGFYTATDVGGLPGDTDVRVAVRTKNPLAGTAEAVADFIDGIAEELGYRRMTAEAARAVRERLIELGYDGIVASDAGGDGIDYVIVIGEGTAKVVAE